MTKKTKMILGGVAVLGVAYYLYKKSQDKEMASMSGYSNMDGVRMSRFANASGIVDPKTMTTTPPPRTGRQQKCQVMNKDGSSWTYNATYGRCDRYGGTLIN